MIGLLTADQLKAQLRDQLDGTNAGKAAVADRLGIAPGALSQMLRTDRTPGHDVAAALGFRRVTVTMFEPIES